MIYPHKVETQAFRQALFDAKLTTMEYMLLAALVNVP